MLKQTALIFLCLLFLIFLFPKYTEAIYDPLSVPNNKFGIHILSTGELQKAAEFVNSQGGEWGYVTIPIRANERDVEKWTKFMEEAKSKKIIPILRIATYPVGDHWMAPNEWDLIDFSNFLNDLPWPTKNRYVMIYNEPNHKGEWGGFVYPEEYARVLDRGTDIFHKKNPDFFVISGGMDAAAPNGADTMNNLTYLKRMEAYQPGIFKKIDGFSAHAYGNYAFQSPPNSYSPVNIKSYVWELDLLKQFGVDNPKLFITEAGWKSPATKYYTDAFQNYWTEPNIVAITPFLLGAHDGPFIDFSFTNQNGEFVQFAKDLQKLPKIKGQPQLNKSDSTFDNYQVAEISVAVNKKLKQTNTELENFVNKIFSFLRL